MAVLTGAGAQIFGDNPVDLGALVDNGTVGVGTPTSTAFSARNAGFGLQWNFTGSGFSGFIDGFPSAGTITGVTFTRPGSSVTISGTSVSVPTVVLLLNVNDFAGITALMLANADTLTGTAFDDQLNGFAGNDSATGGAGSDGILGGAGLDSLFGESGDDRINGGADNDLIDGGDNNDYLLGGAGADTLIGGAGDDTLVRLGSDGAAADVLDGGAGVDRAQYAAFGSTGLTIRVADLATAAGVTLADGTVIRNVEAITFTGGSGADTLVVTTGSNIGNQFFGGAGTDTFVADYATSTLNLSYFGGIIGSPSFFDSQTIESDVELIRITTGSGRDQLRGGVADEAISAGAGDDSVEGGGGADTIDGGAGDDFLSASGFPMSGIDGIDIVRGGSGNDTISGSEGEDQLFGDDGDDVISALAANTINGGAGFDQLLLDLRSAAANIVITSTASGFSASGVALDASNVEAVVGLDSGSGDDRFTVTAPFEDVTYRFSGGSGFDVFSTDYSGYTFGITVDLFGIQITNARGGANLFDVEALNIKTGTGHDSLSGGAAADTLIGGAGDDRFGFAVGADRIDGGDGDDIVIGFSGPATLNGGAGIDRITLDDSATTVGRVYDLLNLVSADFVFRGATVRNFERFTLVAGSGDDTFNFASLGDGHAVDGSGGSDAINIDLSGSAFAISALAGSIGLQSTSASLMYVNFEFAAITGTALDDSIDGGTTTPTVFDIRGGGGSDLLIGGAKNDSLDGDAGLDEIDGGGGNDVLDGGADVDRLTGGDGDDLLLGGDGDDRIVWDAGRDALDGGAGFDRVDFSEAASGLNVNLANRTVIAGGALAGGVYAGGFVEDSIISIERIIGSMFADRLVASNAGSEIDGNDGSDRISGLNGSDRIFGGVGDDTIDGGVGDDLLDGAYDADSVAGGQGADTIIGGEGRDTLDGGTGFDTISFLDKNGVSVNLINGVALVGGFINSAGFYQGGIQEDVISNFENIIGSPLADRLIAGSTSARLEGGQGNDFIFTFSGNDTLFGGGDRDFLSAGRSTDILFGELGDDTLNGGTGFDTLDGGFQDDTADYSDRTGGVNVDLRNGTAITGGTLGASGNYSGGFTEDRLVSIEHVFGSNFGDRLTALSAGSNLEGRGGADRIMGVGGLDTIDGGAGNDTLTGGGAGDLFVFSGSFGADRITDFAGLLSGSSDVIVLSGLGSAFDSFSEVIAAASQSGANVVFNFGGGNTITVLNATLSNFTSSDIFFTS